MFQTNNIRETRMKGFDKQFKNFLFALKDMFITIWLIDQRVYRQMEKKKKLLHFQLYGTSV